MECSRHRRLRHLLGCLGSPAHSSIGASAASSAASSATESELKPLSLAQLKSFIRDGYLVVPVDGVPEGFHEGLYAKAYAMREDEVPDKQGLVGERLKETLEKHQWSTLEDDFNTMMDSPSVRGAAATLAGADCLIPSPGAPRPLTATPIDQQFRTHSKPTPQSACSDADTVDVRRQRRDGAGRERAPAADDRRLVLSSRDHGGHGAHRHRAWLSLVRHRSPRLPAF